MKAPLSWIKKYCNLKSTPQEIADKLTLIGLEVDKIDESDPKDPVLDIALTPNLGYCRSIVGIARELSAHFGVNFTLPSFQLKEDTNNNAENKIQVKNQDPEGCPQYLCRIIQGVEIGPSPAWLVDLLQKAGYQSINNVVDVTNFVMHELGQPLHAFDYEKLTQRKIIIRPAKAHEKIITLDKMSREVPEGATLICDDKKPIAIGGVIGGLDSSITEGTHTVLLESAQFKAGAIRKTSRTLGHRTESSARFENEVDPYNVRVALDRAADLIQQIAGGRVLKGVVEDTPRPYRPRFLTCRLSKINAILGTKLSLSEVEGFLTKLKMTLSSDGVDSYQIKIPSWRNDIQSEIDIVEEVAKVYGFENIEGTQPRHTNSQVAHHPLYLLEKQTRARLVAAGLQEFITCNLISPAQCDLEIENGLFKTEYAKVVHAKSVDQSILRPSLLPGLLQAVVHNQNQGNFDISAFEIGRIHLKEEKGFEEKTTLAVILAGKKAPHHFMQADEDVDFYDLKGIIENLAKALGLFGIFFEASSFTTFHPGRQASLQIKNDTIGVLGEIHPRSLRKLEIRRRVYFAEIDLSLLQKHKTELIKFEPLPQFPSSERDLTFTMEKARSLDAIFSFLKTYKSPLLKEFSLVDIYEDEKIGKENKNITLRFLYRDEEKTIDVEAVEKEHDKLVKSLGKFFS